MRFLKAGICALAMSAAALASMNGVARAADFPACGTYVDAGRHLLPGPGEEGHDAVLAQKARRFERQFHVFNAAEMGVNTDVQVSPESTESRRLIESFIRENDGWDFEEFSGGKRSSDVIDGWSKTAGLYAGVGVAADAFLYGVLRDRGDDCEEIEIARRHLKIALDAMHMAFVLPGKPGAVARGFVKIGLPGIEEHIKTTPLADEMGRPLPLEKNNGTWRDDNSGLYPDYKWEDSNSRDQMLGWAMGYAAAMETIRDDPSFTDKEKLLLNQDAADFLRALKVVHKSGYDLEFPDADGRTTYHGYLNENNVDGRYFPGLKNGFYAIMTLGYVSALSYVAGEPEFEDWLNEELIGKRRLPSIAEDQMKFVDMGEGSNFSNYNMAITAGWLAMRYLKDPEARATVVRAFDKQLYLSSDRDRRPVEMKQSFFDLIYASGQTGGTAYAPPMQEPDASAVGRAVETLREFPDAPFWEFKRENCDEAEIKSGRCVLDDGSEVKLLGNVGWNEDLVADRPIPMRVRPPSNYYWRSNPYTVNGGSEAGAGLLPGVDFRIAYWLGRWTPLPNR